jgi:hypothetical protein
MTKIRMLKWRNGHGDVSLFGFRHSFVTRHSTFVIVRLRALAKSLGSSGLRASL